MAAYLRAHPDSLRDRLLYLKEDASALLVREFLIPYLDALQPQSMNNWERFVDQEQFFSIIRRYHRDREGGNDISINDKKNKQRATTMADNEDTVWAYICDIAASIYSDPDAEPIEEVPEGCIAFSTLRTLAALNTDGVVTGERQRTALKLMIRREATRTGCTTLTRSRFVSLLTKAQDESPCLALLDFEALAFYLFPERSMHSTVLTQLIDRTHKPPVQQSFITDYCVQRAMFGYRLLDMAWNVPFLILFLLVALTYRGINADTFDGHSVYKGIQQRLGEPFTACQLRPEPLTIDPSLVVNGKYNGMDASIASHWQCGGSSSAMDNNSMITSNNINKQQQALYWGDVRTVDDVYSYLLNGVGPMLWNGGTIPTPFEALYRNMPNLTAASSNVSNVLRVVGGIKFRQLRVKPSRAVISKGVVEEGSDAARDNLLTDYYASFADYASVGNDSVLGVGTSAADVLDTAATSAGSLLARPFPYGPYEKKHLDTRQLVFNASTTSSPSSSSFLGDELANAGAVLMPWDGSVFGSCSDLNASTAFALNFLSSFVSDDRRYGCHGHAVIIPFNASRDAFNTVISRLASQKWLSTLSTRALVVEYHLFHPYNGFFVAISHAFEFTAGGELMTRTRVVPYYFMDDVSQTLLVTVGYALFVAFFAILVIRLFVQTVVTRTVFLSTSSALWALYDGVNYAVFLAGICVRLMWMTAGKPESHVWQLEYFPKAYDYTAFLYTTAITIEAFNIILTVVGMARYATFVPMCGTIMRSFARTASLTRSIGALMAAVTYTFAVAGTAAFGASVVGYESVKAAGFSLANVFWGAFDFERLRSDDAFFGFIFFATFALIAIGLLFAMYTAVFANAYMDLQTAEASISAELLSSVMRSNSHHLFDMGTAATRIAGFPPLQLVIAAFQRMTGGFQKTNLASAANEEEEAEEENAHKRKMMGDTVGGDSGADDEDAQKEARSFHQRHRNNRARDGFTYDVYNSNVCDMLLALLQPDGSSSSSNSSGGADAVAMRGRRAPASVTQRTKAAADLLILIATSVPVPTFDPAETDATLYARSPSCSVFDYARKLFGNPLDFSLIMCLYVIIPQERFAQVGGLSLLDALREHRAWVDEVSGRSPQSSVAERLQLRIDQMLEKQMEDDQQQHEVTAHKANSSNVVDYTNKSSASVGGGGGATPKVVIASYTQNPPPVGVEEAGLVGSMSHLNRRVFLGMMAMALEEHYEDEGNTLSVERFVDIAYSLQGYPIGHLPAERLWHDLGIATYLKRRQIQEAHLFGDGMRGDDDDDDASLPPPPHLFMRGFIPLFQREYAVQCLGCDLDPEEIVELDAKLRKVTIANANGMTDLPAPPNNAEKDPSKTGGDASAASVSGAQPSNVDGPTAPPSPSSGNEADGRARRFSSSGADGGALVAAAGDNENNAVGMPLVQPITHPFVTRQQFEETWVDVIQSEPPQKIVQRIFRIMPSGVLDPALFLHYCRSNPMTASAMSLESKFARSMQSRSNVRSWLSLYVPLMVLLLYFLLVGYSMDEAITVSEGIKAALAPRGLHDDAKSRPATGGITTARGGGGGSGSTASATAPAVDSMEGVRSFLRKTVATIWQYDLAANGRSNASLSLPQNTIPTTPTPLDAAQPIAQANYPIGAVRIRQLRVRSDARKRCDKIYDAYFGNSDSRTLSFPDSMSNADRDFYAARIGLDYEDIVNGACFSNYDKGDREKKLKLFNVTIPSFIPGLGMWYSNTSGSAATGQHSSYHAGGFIMDIPITSPSATAMGYVEELLTNYYVDRMTRYVVVEVVTYNPNLNLNAFSRFGFELTGGGAILPISEVFVAPHTEYPSAAYVVCSVLIWALLIVYLAFVVNELIRHIATDESLYLHSTVGAALLSLYSNPWYIVDCFVIVVFFISWGWRATRYGHDGAVDSIANALPFSESFFVSARYNDAAFTLGQFASDIEKTCVLTRTIRRLEAVLLLAAFSRLYSIVATHASLRPLRVLYDTYATASKDLASLLAMLLSVLVGFTLAANLLFGYSVDKLFSFEYGYSELFAMALLQFKTSGAYFEDAFEISPAAAFVFQILLISVTVFFVFGMTVAVLTGAVSAVLDAEYDGDQCEEVLASEQNAFDSIHDTYYNGGSSDDDADGNSGDDGAEGSNGNGYSSTDSSNAEEEQRLMKKMSVSEMKAKIARRKERQQLRAHNKVRKVSKRSGVASAIIRVFGWFMTSALVREPIQLYYTTQHAFKQWKNIPLSILYCSSDRAMWNNLSSWWSDVDSQPPGRATISGLHLLVIAREVREAKDALYAMHNAAVERDEIAKRKRIYRRAHVTNGGLAAKSVSPPRRASLIPAPAAAGAPSAGNAPPTNEEMMAAVMAAVATQPPPSAQQQQQTAEANTNTSKQQKKRRLKVPHHEAVPSYVHRRAHTDLADRDGEDIIVLAMEAENERILLGLPTLPSALLREESVKHKRRSTLRQMQQQEAEGEAGVGGVGGRGRSARNSVSGKNTLVGAPLSSLSSSPSSFVPSAPLETYGADRRIQSWQEYLFTTFGTEYATMQRHLISTPNAVKALWYSNLNLLTTASKEEGEGGAKMHAADNNAEGSGDAPGAAYGQPSDSPAVAEGMVAGGASDSQTASQQQQQEANDNPELLVKLAPPMAVSTSDSLGAYPVRRSSRIVFEQQTVTDEELARLNKEAALLAEAKNPSSSSPPIDPNDGKSLKDRVKALLLAAAATGAAATPDTTTALWRKALMVQKQHRDSQKRLGMGPTTASAASVAALGPMAAINGASESDLLLMELCARLPTVASKAAPMPNRRYASSFFGRRGDRDGMDSLFTVDGQRSGSGAGGGAHNNASTRAHYGNATDGSAVDSVSSPIYVGKRGGRKEEVDGNSTMMSYGDGVGDARLAGRSRYERSTSKSPARRKGRNSGGGGGDEKERSRPSSPLRYRQHRANVEGYRNEEAEGEGGATRRSKASFRRRKVSAADADGVQEEGDGGVYSDAENTDATTGDTSAVNLSGHMAGSRRASSPVLRRGQSGYNINVDNDLVPMPLEAEDDSSYAILGAQSPILAGESGRNAANTTTSADAAARRIIMGERGPVEVLSGFNTNNSSGIGAFSPSASTRRRVRKSVAARRGGGGGVEALDSTLGSTLNGSSAFLLHRPNASLSEGNASLSEGNNANDTTMNADGSGQGEDDEASRQLTLLLDDEASRARAATALFARSLGGDGGGGDTTSSAVQKDNLLHFTTAVSGFAEDDPNVPIDILLNGSSGSNAAALTKRRRLAAAAKKRSANGGKEGGDGGDASNPAITIDRDALAAEIEEEQRKRRLANMSSAAVNTDAADENDRGAGGSTFGIANELAAAGLGTGPIRSGELFAAGLRGEGGRKRHDGSGAAVSSSTQAINTGLSRQGILIDAMLRQNELSRKGRQKAAGRGEDEGDDSDNRNGKQSSSQRGRGGKGEGDDGDYNGTGGLNDGSIFEEANRNVEDDPNYASDGRNRRAPSPGRKKAREMPSALDIINEANDYMDRSGGDADAAGANGGAGSRRGSRSASAQRRRRGSAGDPLTPKSGALVARGEGGESDSRTSPKRARKMSNGHRTAAGDPDDDDDFSPNGTRRSNRSGYNTSRSGSIDGGRSRRPPRSSSFNNSQSERGGYGRSSRPASPNGNNSSRTGSPNLRKRGNSPGQYHPDDYLSPKERHSHWLPSGKAEIPDLRRMMQEKEEKQLKKSLQSDGYTPTHECRPRSGSRPLSPTYGL